ncbi:DegT/DnrJ/EryC1/StrS family aminotransferase [Candidatus Aerophobetes bacterium]|nr:DegT/DnrJ/EryC1/StrS family aminotransferase [Candidatus Aerophobetes bacterium]
MKIPLLDLKGQFKTIQDEIEKAVRDVLESGRYILGPNVEALEEEVANYCGASYAIGVASGTDALRLSLLALGIGEGDEVITTPFTFIATVEVITQVGATPVFVDIDEQTFNIDVDKIENAITSRTKAILPVHIFGHPVDMEKLLKIKEKYNILIIEDAAQAFGSECNLSHDKNQPQWKKVGSIGDAGCFSFFPTKNLGGAGDGGMVVTNSKDVAERLRLLRAHGGNSSKYSYNALGYNSRLDELQAAILRVKLKYVDKWINLRRERASLYNELFSDIPLRVPCCESYAKHTFCVYTVKSPLRDKLREYLQTEGIGTKIYYPIPVHLQIAYKNLNYREGGFPAAEKACKQVISLPIYPELEKDKIFYIAEKIKNFFKRESL